MNGLTTGVGNMTQIFLLKLENGAEFEARADDALNVRKGETCVFSKDFHIDLAEVIRPLDEPSGGASPASLPEIQRIATVNDLANANANVPKEREAMKSAGRFVEQLALPMKLINAHYSLDGKLVTIQFSADGRVDFRELVKELSRALSTRIELRQIGVRDETGIYGGIAVCGRELCCCRILKDFNSINVRMAKEQDLSLTPATISGVCGRLKCCLKYEHEGYVELEKGMPRKGEFCDTPSGRGRITDRNILLHKVTVTFEGGSVSTFSADEVKVVPPPERKNGGSSRRQGQGGGRSRRSGETPPEKEPAKESGE